MVVILSHPIRANLTTVPSIQMSSHESSKMGDMPYDNPKNGDQAHRQW